VRRTYKLWEEGRAPSLVIEVTSKSTQSEDEEKKKGVYERLGVEEYFLFDPFGEYLEPRLQGYRLVRGRYQPLRPQADGSLASRTTNLELVPEGARLRLRDAATGEPLLWGDETEEARQAAEQGRQAAEQARQVAEEARQSAEVQAERERLARQVAEEARQSAEVQAERERLARQAAEERVRALEEQLARRHEG
jgi:hypothetical protein